jgi:hypothetical protein
MKTTYILTVIIVSLSACSNSEGPGNSGAAGNAGAFSGMFAGKDYSVTVSCSYLDESYFMLKSDQTDISDSNGDDLVISGIETNGSFSLPLSTMAKSSAHPILRISRNMTIKPLARDNYLKKAHQLHVLDNSR